MRHKLLLPVLFFFAALLIQPAQAQLRYGFRFGGLFAAEKLKDASGYTAVNRSGFTGGLVLEYQSKTTGFAPDIALLYGRHNTRLRDVEGNTDAAGRNFIDIPIHIKYKFWLPAVKKLVGPMIYTGPVLSFRTGSDDSFYRTKGFQPGWDVGVGFDIVNFIQITGGYRFGLGNAIKDFPACPDAELRTNGWNVAVTLLFDF